MKNLYDNERFFAEYAKMDRSRRGLAGAGEWHQLEPLFPPLQGLAVLDLGCGYGWHCQYAAGHGAARVLGIDGSERMSAAAPRPGSATRSVPWRITAIRPRSTIWLFPTWSSTTSGTWTQSAAGSAGR